MICFPSGSETVADRDQRGGSPVIPQRLVALRPVDAERGRGCKVARQQAVVGSGGPHGGRIALQRNAALEPVGIKLRREAGLFVDAAVEIGSEPVFLIHYAIRSLQDRATRGDEAAAIITRAKARFEATETHRVGSHHAARPEYR